MNKREKKIQQLFEQSVYPLTPDRFNELKSKNIDMPSIETNVKAKFRWHPMLVTCLAVSLLVVGVYGYFHIQRDPTITAEVSSTSGSSSAFESTSSKSGSTVEPSSLPTKGAPNSVTLEEASQMLGLALKIPQYLPEQYEQPKIYVRKNTENIPYSVNFQYDMGSISITKEPLTINKIEYKTEIREQMTVYFQTYPNSINLFYQDESLTYNLALDYVSLDSCFKILKSVCIQ